MRWLVSIAMMLTVIVPSRAELQRKPNRSEKALLRNATAQQINISNANFSFLALPKSWKSGTFAYYFGIWPKTDRTRFDCVEAIIEMKKGIMVAVESVSFDDAKACEGARAK